MDIHERLYRWNKKATENRIEALITALQVTIHEPTRIELAHRLNRLNNYYLWRYEIEYKPK